MHGAQDPGLFRKPKVESRKPNRAAIVAAFLGACGPAAAPAPGSQGSTLRPPEGSPVAGPADTHCDGKPPRAVDPGQCMSGSHAGGGPYYGDTLFNSAGMDDDCKYLVGFQASTLQQDRDVIFQVTLNAAADGLPVVGADVRARVFLSPTHDGPHTVQAPAVQAPGVYSAGPVRFDAPGRWTVRFHFFPDCDDGETSPHGHAAFFLDVP